MKTLLTFLVLGLGFSALAQADFDKRLLAKFTEERIQHLQEEHNAVIQYWSFYLDHSFVIIEGDKGKAQKQEEEVKIKDIDNFNILDLDVHMARSQSLAYRIKGTDKYLIMLSNEAFTKKLNRQN